MLYGSFMGSLLMAELNMTFVVFLQIVLPIAIALLVRKQSDRFQRNYIKVMLVLGLGSTPLLLWWLNSILTKSSP